MPVIHGVTEKAFKKIAKRLHHTLQPTPNPSLVQVQEMLSKALGLGPLHVAQQGWGPSSESPLHQLEPLRQEPPASPIPITALQSLSEVGAAMAADLHQSLWSEVSGLASRLTMGGRPCAPSAIDVSWRAVGIGLDLVVRLAPGARKLQSRCAFREYRGYPVHYHIGFAHVPWSTQEEKAWQALPALYREAPEIHGVPFMDTPTRRRERMQAWSDRDDRFRHGIRSADQGTETLIAWGKTVNLADEDELKFDGNSVEVFLLGLDRLDLYEALARLPHAMGPVGACHMDPSLFWSHPEPLRLLSLVKDTGLAWLMWYLAGSVRPPNATVATSPETIKRLCEPVLKALADRLPAPLDADQKVAWDILLASMARKFKPTGAGLKNEPPLTVSERRQWHRIPSRWFVVDFEHHDQAKSANSDSEKRRLIGLYFSLPSLWRSALEALEENEATVSFEYEHREDIKTTRPWRDWLAANKDRAADLTGVCVDHADQLLPAPIHVRDLLKCHRQEYKEWMLAGLPAAFAPGEEGLRGIWG